MTGKQCKALKNNNEQCTRSVYHQSGYCWQHRFSRRNNAHWYQRPIIQSFLAVITIVGFVLAINSCRSGATKENLEEILKRLPDTANPIVLSAERIDLGTGTQKAMIPFSVRNIGETDLYQVVVKFLIESSVLSATNNDIAIDNLDIPPSTEMPHPVDGSPSLEALTSSLGWMFVGMDFEDRAGIWLIIEHLPPKTCAKFRIRNQSVRNLPTESHRLLASVTFYTNSPPVSSLTDDGALLQLTPLSTSMGLKANPKGVMTIWDTIRVVPASH